MGLGTISLGVDLKLFHTVGDYPLCGLKKSSRFGHIAFRVFEGIDNQLFLNVSDSPFKGEGGDCP